MSHGDRDPRAVEQGMYVNGQTPALGEWLLSARTSNWKSRRQLLVQASTGGQASGQVAAGSQDGKKSKG
jgi:hypothetical protein